MNVARWNFAINRSQYLKLALSLFLVMSLPLLLFILKSVWVLGITGNREWAIASMPGVGMGTWMCGCFIFSFPILAGYTFHNLLTKQSRIKELTLPATNGEKFLFHALVTIGGALLTYVVSFLLLDVIQYLFVGIVYGFSYSEWVPYASIFFNGEFRSGDSLYVDSPWFLVIMDLALIAFLSTFVLGNAIKYRHNTLWTILFHWGMGFATMLCLGLCLPLLKDVDWGGFAEWLQGIDEDNARYLLRGITIIFFSGIIAFCWWMSYRLYCRAQITTKRNK